MRWIVRIAGVLITLVVLAVGALFLIPAERIAGIAVGKFNSLTGRTLIISGAVRPTLWPTLGVQTGPVTLSNAAWSTEGPMLEAEALAIALDASALIGGEVRILGVTATAPRIVLERNASGGENWVFGPASGGTVTTETPGVGTPFTLERATITGGSLVFIDHAAGTRTVLSDIAAEVAIPDYTGAARVQMQATKNGQAFAADLGIGAFQAFLDGKLVSLDLSLTAGAADVQFDGRAGLSPLMAEGEVTADLGDLSALSALAGLAAPALPEGLGARQVAVTAALTLTAEASVHLRKADITLDGNSMAAELDVTTAGERPALSAQITAGAVNLAGLSGNATSGGAASAPVSGWPREGIDASGLNALDATVAFSAESVDLGAARLGAVQVLATIDRGRAVFDLRRIAAYDGTVTGEFVVNARNGLSVGGDLAFADIAMQTLLAETAGTDRLIGTGDLRLKFLGSGPSVDAIMRSLDGSGSLSLGKGEVRGLDIAGMIATLDTGYVGEGQKTIFDGISAGFAIAGGVLTNDDLTLSAPLITATGEGAVDLGAQRLDYRLKPVLITGDQSGVTVPLLISGSWANPQVRLDLEGLAAEKLAEEAAKLEAVAREKAAELEVQARARAKELEAEARARLEAELGVVQQDGESLEDAARRRAEEALAEEAARALGRLLGGGAAPTP